MDFVLKMEPQAGKYWTFLAELQQASKYINENNQILYCLQFYTRTSAAGR